MVIIWGTWTADDQKIWTLQEDRRIMVQMETDPGQPVRAGIQAEFAPGEVVKGELIQGGTR